MNNAKQFLTIFASFFIDEREVSKKKILVWALFISIICGLIYEPNYRELKENKKSLEIKLYELLEEKERALVIQKDLLARIHSQSDQDWIEMTLMRKLGVVPEGQVKVYIPKSSSDQTGIK